MLYEISTHQLIRSIILLLDARDPYTYEHSERVAALSELIAIELNLDDKEITKIHYAAHLHDIGKIGVPDCVLNKEGLLSEEEYLLMRSHPRIGYNILNNIKILSPLSEYVLYHHERYDGYGYPSGLKSLDIPLGSRIIAAADTFDAMTSKRTYKNSISIDKAFEELEKVKGSQLCPEVVDCMIRIRAKILLLMMDINNKINHHAFYDLKHIQNNRSVIIKSLV